MVIGRAARSTVVPLNFVPRSLTLVTDCKRTFALTLHLILEGQTDCHTLLGI